MDQEKLNKIKKNVDQNAPLDSNEFETELDIAFDNDLDFSDVDFSDVEDLNTESKNIDTFELLNKTVKEETPIVEKKEIITENIKNDSPKPEQTQKNDTKDTSVSQTNTDQSKDSTINAKDKQDSEKSNDKIVVISNSNKNDAPLKNVEPIKAVEKDLENRIEDIEQNLTSSISSSDQKSVNNRNRISDDSLFAASTNEVISTKEKDELNLMNNSKNKQYKQPSSYKIKKPTNKSSVIPWVIFILLSIAIAFLAAYLYLSLNNINPTRIFNTNNYTDLTKSASEESLITNTQILGVNQNELTDNKLSAEVTDSVTSTAISEDINQVIKTKEFANLGNNILSFNLK